MPRAGIPSGLYRGIGTAVAGSVPGSAIFFTVYESSRTALEAGGVRRPWSALLSSALGEFIASTVRMPVDFMKQRQQTISQCSFADAARGLLATRSAVLMASFRATASRDILHSGLQFSMYEHLKVAVASHGGHPSADRLPIVQAAACGSIAGAASAVLTTPVDLVRTRINLRCSADPAQHAPGWRALLAEEIREVHHVRGLSGFFTGAGLRGASMGIGGFVFLGAFELAKSQLNK